MAPPSLVPKPSSEDKGKERLERSLHDMTNGLQAARSFGELLLRRTKASDAAELAPLVESLVAELDKVIDISKDVRRDTYHKGDVLSCTKCGYTFVQLKANGPAPACRRCFSTDVRKWKPSG